MPDDELVASAMRLHQAVAPAEVVVVSRDIGVRTRARAWGLPARPLPDAYLIEGGELRWQELDQEAAQVASAVADALRRDAFREALVATYVWGKGKRGTPGGSGPSTLDKILAFDGLVFASHSTQRSCAASWTGSSGTSNERFIWSSTGTRPTARRPCGPGSPTTPTRLSCTSCRRTHPN